MQSSLALYDALLQAQVPPIAAEKAASALESDMTTVLATKQDLKNEFGLLRTELQHEVGALRTEMRNEIGTLRTEMHHEIGTLRTEMHHEIGALRTEMHHEIGSLRHDMQALGNRLVIRLSGVMVAVVGLATTAQQLLG